MMVFDIEERVARAKRLFKEEGYKCCQAVVLAYNDIFGMDDHLAASLASGFGGGMGRMREVCGSVSGMVMLAGLIAPAADPSAKDGRTRNYSLVQEAAGEFKEINGSIVCKELLGLVPMGSSSPRGCISMVLSRPSSVRLGISGCISWNLSNQGPFMEVSPPYQPK